MEVRDPGDHLGSRCGTQKVHEKEREVTHESDPFLELVQEQ
jgi:hypothetical protein